MLILGQHDIQKNSRDYKNNLHRWYSRFCASRFVLSNCGNCFVSRLWFGMCALTKECYEPPSFKNSLFLVQTIRIKVYQLKHFLLKIMKAVTGSSWTFNWNGIWNFEKKNCFNYPVLIYRNKNPLLLLHFSPKYLVLKIFQDTLLHVCHYVSNKSNNKNDLVEWYP